MIIARKILRKALSSRPLLRYMGSTQANGQPADLEVELPKLSPEAQRALWANHFINTIIEQQMATTLSSPSLHEKLIDSPNPIPNYIFDQVVKKEMTAIFTEGAYFDPTVFQQIRITKARIKDEKLAFYPSVFVTTKIFTQMRHSRQRMMFQGCYGIGKTISIAFYIYLSNIINKYALLAAKDENLLKEYESLVQKAYLPRENKKYWYWSMDWDLVQLKDFSLQRILAEQATELTKRERNQIRQCKDSEEAQEKISQLYGKINFTHIAVLDQINHAVSFIRKWNQFVQKNKDLIDQANNKSTGELDQQKIKQFYEPTANLISLAKQFTAINPVHYVLNSSVNIERELLEEQSSKKRKPNQKEAKPYKPLTFQLKSKNKGHSPMDIFSFPFQQEIQTQGGKVRFWQFFLNILEEKVQRKNLKEQEWKNFKDAFLTYACSIDLKSYYRFLHIRLFLQTYKAKIKALLRGQDINTAIKEIIYAFEKSSFQEFQRNLIKFMEKGDTKLKIEIIKAIYTLAFRTRQNNEKKFIVDFLLIGRALKYKQISQIKALREYFLSSEHNKQLIPVQTVSDPTKLLMLWTPEEFIEITKPLLFSFIYTGQVLLPEYEIGFMYNNPTYRGHRVEQHLGLLLGAGSEIIFSNVKSERKFSSVGGLIRSRQYLQYQSQQILIEGSVDFISFLDESAASYTLEQHFEKVLAHCEGNPDKWISSFPVRAKGQKFVFNNTSVDFALVKCSTVDNTKKYLINTYDVTIVQSTVKSKEDKALVLLRDKATNLNRDIQVCHHILCIKKHCVGVLKVNDRAKICYSNFQDMEIIKAPGKTNEMNVFEEIKMCLAKFIKGVDTLNLWKP